MNFYLKGYKKMLENYNFFDLILLFKYLYNFDKYE